MSSSWPTAARSTESAPPPAQHVCIGGLAISTCPRCAGHPQGYRNPICQQCKGCGVVTETCRQCLLNNAGTSSTSTSQMTSPATSCSGPGYGGGFSNFYGQSVDEEDQPEDQGRRRSDADGKDQAS